VRPTALLVGLLLALLLSPILAGAVVDDARADATVALGVYRGSAAPAQVAEFGAWLGRNPTVALDYVDPSSWATIEDPTWWANAWSKSPYRVVYSVALIPDSGGSLQEGARGTYNVHFRRLAETLVRHGQANAVIRLGWEFNGEWTRWTAQRDPEAFSAYWRLVVETMRSVPGAQFEFDWCVALGRFGVVEAAYPGDSYVDFVGMDAYDTWWNEAERTDLAKRWQRMLDEPGGLRWHRDFARAHGKRMTYPEWGLWIRPDGRGGGDNPYYVEKMHQWITQNDVAYHAYFDHDAEDGQHRLLAHFPRGASIFRSLFRPQSVAAESPGPAAQSPQAAPEQPDEVATGSRRWRSDLGWRKIRARR
jgi:hypothetical protein